jgi:hypothetical protein
MNPTIFIAPTVEIDSALRFWPTKKFGKTIKLDGPTFVGNIGIRPNHSALEVTELPGKAYIRLTIPKAVEVETEHCLKENQA